LIHLCSSHEKDVTMPASGNDLPLGSWARSGSFTGLVARSDELHVTLFDPGSRQQHQAARGQVQPVPAAAVRVTVTVDLPLPHGFDEDSLRRWVGVLTDPVLRERAAAAMSDAGLDPGAAQPEVSVDVRALDDGLARCLCGATTPAASGVAVICSACGRQAAPPVSL
jgi:hypothetical protein